MKGIINNALLSPVTIGGVPTACCTEGGKESFLRRIPESWAYRSSLEKFPRA